MADILGLWWAGAVKRPTTAALFAIRAVLLNGRLETIPNNWLSVFQNRKQWA
jgi:hypothetical protein